MTFRAAEESDAPALDAFLARHAESSMFLRSNLAASGPCGAGRFPFTTRMWFSGSPDAPDGVIGVTRMGWLLMQVPNGISSGPLCEILAGTRLQGVNGEAGQVTQILDALNLTAAGRSMDAVQPLYSLPLSDLAIPPGETRLAGSRPSDLSLLTGWRAHFLTEVMSMHQSMAQVQAPSDLKGLLEDDRLRVLEDADGPVAMTAFNAALPDMVQVGNVYTPPTNRGRGHARRAVALHLAEARDGGVTRAILASASPAANRAYEAVGFRRHGDYGFIHFSTPQIVEPAP